MGVRSLLRTNILNNPKARNVSSTLDFGPNVTFTQPVDGAEVIHTNGTIAGNAYFAIQGPVVTGVVYYWKAVIEQISGNVDAQVALHSSVGSAMGSTVVMTKVGNILTATSTSTSTITGTARLLIDFRGAGLGEAYKIKEMIVTESPDTSYFDGSSMETRDRFYKWTGMVNGSPSEEYLIVPDEWSPMGKALAELKRNMIEVILGPTPTMPTGDLSFNDMKKAGIEKVLTDNGLI